MHKQIFINLPVRDLGRSRAFFASLGFAFDPQFSNEDAACMIIGENIFAMLLVERFFQGFTSKPVANAFEVTEALTCLSCESREEVDALVARALAAGGRAPNPKQDHGFMYGHGFEDLDGHVWELAWMNPDAVPPGVMRADVDRAIGAVWRIESAKIVAGVARLVRDIGLAEELAGDALVAALEHWPATGVPDNPGAWLMRTAKNAALDRLRRDKVFQEKLQQIGLDLEAQEALIVPDFVDSLDAARQDLFQDDLLRLIFTACHPVLPVDSRVALTLKLLGGLNTLEIARAFLVPGPTIAQRIVRAKRTLGKARVPFELPGEGELPERLGSVLEVVYLIFNEGYTATAGEDWMRPALMDEALRLGRMLAELAPLEPEAHGLAALMELQASRARARLDAEGKPVLLLDQDRARWDGILVRRGLAALARAERLGGAPGPYQLQAAIAACHARAHTAPDTDWARIAALYGELAQVQPSPVVELNRAVAVGMAEGPAAGLALADALVEDGALAGYQWLPSVRGDLLEKLGRRLEAAAEFERAAGMAANARERTLLLDRARANAAGGHARSHA